MMKLLALLQLSTARMYDDLQRAKHDERGSVTTEHVLWAVAVIAIVGIVVAVLKAYVTSQAGNIK